jgi:folate-binding protein YgfZ
MRLARSSSGQGLALGLAPVEGLGQRWWLVVPIDALPAVWAGLAGRLVGVDSDAFRGAEILAGEPRIVPPTSEAFVPQTLNWELIGGVSFRKGCYPGQEIVARMHYRGKPKRRSFAARLAAGPMPAPAEDLFASGTTDPVGVVVSAATAPDGGTVLLYEAPIDTALGEGLCCADGRKLEPLPLPYPIPA